MSEASKKSKRKISGFTEQAIELLQRYNWPGNIRELENVVERAVVLGKGELIQPSDLPAPLHRQLAGEFGGTARGQLKASLQQPERRLILDALEAHGWNRQDTAAALGINRTTLYKKMKKYGLDVDHPLVLR